MPKMHSAVNAGFIIKRDGEIKGKRNNVWGRGHEAQETLGADPDAQASNSIQHRIPFGKKKETFSRCQHLNQISV